MNDPYLWDRSDPPNPEISELEKLLAPLRMQEKAPNAPPYRPSILARSAALLRRHWEVSVAAASAAALLLAAWIAMSPPAFSSSAWEARAVSGAPELSGRKLKDATLQPGEWLTTNGNSVVHVRAGTIGEIEIARDSLVSLAESRQDSQRLLLRYGSIHARISAPPRLFIVDTPAARAVDLGCEYTLKIERNGSGELTVLAGWVELSHISRQSLVPAGASARIASDGTLSPPYFGDASAAFKQALLDFSFNLGDRARHRAALDTVLRESRQRDSLTLLNLFARADTEERLQLFDRLNQLVPAPPLITRETVRDWELNSMNAWWPLVEKQLRLSEIKKGNRPLNAD
jgi:FecR protein